MGITTDHHIAQSIQLFEDAGATTPATRALGTHSFHGIGSSSIALSGPTIITGNHATMTSGLSNNGMGRGESLMSGYMGMLHGGGKIAPELMVRTSTNSQVGGQVAYHKPG
jgi:hypothetical protein